MTTRLFSLVVGMLLLATVSAQADTPTVTTAAATGVTDITATLNGTLTTAGTTLYGYFEWGVTTAYGTAISATPAAISDFNTSEVTAAPWGLQSSTTYHYRFLAQYFDGTPIYGQDMTFTTGPPATLPSITGAVACTSVGKTQELVSVLNVAAGGSPATFGFEYGTTTAYGSFAAYSSGLTTNGSVGQPQVYLTGLAPGTTYHVRCTATNGQGTVSTPDATFTTRAAAVFSTGAATDVTDLSATLNGLLTANGNSLTMGFEWGTTTNYGGYRQVYGSGIDPQNLTAAITGLLPSTLYHYRLKVYDYEQGDSYGSDNTFTTGVPATPPAVGLVTSQGIGPTYASLVAYDLVSGSSPANVSFEYGVTTSYGSTASYAYNPVATSTFTSAYVDLTGLSPATVYHYRCRVTNAEGTIYSYDGMFTTSPAPTLTTGPVSGITDLAANFSGSVNANGNVIVHAWIEYGETTSYGTLVGCSPSFFTGTSTVPVTAGTAALLPSTLYHYRIKVNDAYSDFYGPDQMFTTNAATTPPTVGTIGAYNVTTTTAKVNCYPVASGSSPATVVFEYGLDTSYGSTLTVDPVLPTNVTSLAPEVSLAGLTPLTTYHVRCTVTNAQGSVTSQDGTFATPGIPVVTTAAATSVGDLSADLGGSINPNGPSSTATPIFEIGTTTDYGSTVAATPGSILSSSLTPFAGTATGLLPNTTYHYRAKVTYSFTNNSFYGPDVVFTTGPAATPPTVGPVFTNQVTATTAAVETFTVTAGSSQASVFWEIGTTIAYDTTVASSPATIPVSGSDTASVILQNLTPGTTYHYRCKATNSEGTSYSPDATFTTLPGPALTTGAATAITDLTAVLNGTANANGGSYTLSFHVHLPSGDTVVVGTTSSTLTGSTSFPVTGSVSGLLPNTTYTYRLAAQNSSQDYFFGEEQSFTTGPPNTPPTLTSVSASNAAPTAATLQVNSLSAGSSTTTLVFEYGLTNAYGAQVTYGSTFPASTNAGPTYHLEGLTPNTTYHFRATVTNNEGTNASSDATFTTRDLPTVTTDAATGVMAISAGLNGTYNKQGANYSIAFDYGLTTAYGLTATSGGLVLGGGGGIIIGGGGGIIIGIGGSDSNPHTTSAPATGLSPQTTYHYRLKLTDNYGNSYYGSDATLTTVTPVEGWRALKFGDTSNSGNGADNANPSGDGIPNLMKYALGLDPAVPGTMPQAELQDDQIGASHLGMNFLRYVANTDITYEVQAADSPAGPWDTVATSAAGAAFTGPGLVSETGFLYQSNFGLPPSLLIANQVLVQDPTSTADAPRRFMRLKVTR